MSAFDPLRTSRESRYALSMTRWLPFLALFLTACIQGKPTAEECKALAAPEAVIKRCYGGHLGPSAKYVGDLKCWPFSNTQRLRGLWLIRLEASEFYQNSSAVENESNLQPPVWRPQVWLESGLFERRPELLAAAQGAGTRAYAVELDGRQALCDGSFGHLGIYPRQVIAERFHSMRLLPKARP
jgi:hypothetical protein